MSERVLEVQTGPDTLAEIQRTLDLAWAEDDVPEYTKMCIELAVSEIGTNIIAYSADGKSVRMRMAIDVRPDHIAVTFTDDGHSAPIDLTRLSMPDEIAESGRGLALAHRVLDKLSYWRDEHGNHWTLNLRRPE